MGIETLNNAAWAAGFAMAASEEFDDAGGPVRAADAQWRPGEAVIVREQRVDRVDWVKALLGLFARRAPLSPA
jgi:hypothetical protein